MLQIPLPFFTFIVKQSNIPMSLPPLHLLINGLRAHYLQFHWPNYIPGFARLITAFYNPDDGSSRSSMGSLGSLCADKPLSEE